MEDSQVLDAESKAAPLQAPEAIHETSQTITPKNETPNKNIYGGPSPVVGEKNHADEISTQINRSDYSFKSPVDNSKEPTVTTVSTTKGNVTDKAYWQAHYGMDNTYKATDNEDYSWNKLAKEMAALDYAQESNQARYESMQTKQEMDKAATQAFNNYFAAEYSARQTQEKMGWSGGQQTASDLQVAFLQAETAANMYTQDEMQRYGVETKLGIARMYAEANQRALALEYYQDAVDQSIKEAEQVNRNAQRYYDSKGFQRGYAYDEKGKVVTEYYGIKCLQTLQYEETVRITKLMSSYKNKPMI